MCSSVLRTGRSAVGSVVLCVAVGLLVVLLRTEGKAAGQSATAGTDARDRSDAPLLTPPVRIDDSLAGGESRSVPVQLQPGDELHAVLDQGFSDFTVSVFGPAGAQAVEIDGRWHGPESVSVVARSEGVYRLEVRTVAKSAPPTSYRLSVDEIRRADAASEDRVLAERMATQGKRLVTRATAETLQQAIRIYEEVLPVWRALGDRFGEAQTLTTLGNTQLGLSQFEPAVASLKSALAIWNELDDATGKSQALTNLGSVSSRTGKKREALSFYTQGLELAVADGNNVSEAFLHNNLGVVYAEIGEHQNALREYQHALRLWRELRDSSLEATVLANIGATYMNLSEHQQALDRLHEALPIFRSVGNTVMETVTLNNIGQVYRALADGRLALDYFERALPLAQTIGDRRLEPITVQNVASALRLLGRDAEAVEQLRRAVTLGQATGDPRTEGMSWTRIGDVRLAEGEFKEARDHFERALVLFRVAGDRRNEANALIGLASAQSKLEDREAALETLAIALVRSREVADRATEAQALLHRAGLRRDDGNLAAAATDSEAALGLIETLRVAVVSPELRTSYLASKQQFYEFYVDLLMRRHAAEPDGDFARAALQAAERARARGLMDMLAESRGQIRHGGDQRLLEQERALQRLVNDKAERLTRVLSGPSTPASVTEAMTLESEMRELLDEFRSVQSRIRATSPRYASLTQPTPLTLSQIQRELLDADTALLEYALGDDRSYAWVVTRAALHGFELPPRRDIEAAAHAYAEGVSSGAPVSTALNRAAATLADLLLRPLADRLTAKRLLIVSDGALEYVPFSALPSPRANGKALIADYEIVTAPSASTIPLLRAEAAARRRASKTLAVLADPVFTASDPRVGGTVATRGRAVVAVSDAQREAERDRTATAELVDVTRAAGALNTTSSGAFELPRLPFTRREAQELLRLVGARETLVAMDFDASLSTIHSPALADYRILHLATHGFVNPAHPELSGLVLSLVDANGRSRSGFLRAHDIFNLELGAELVVLSACRSALGAEIRGEGLMSITRGFMYAGASRVMASLWKVDDEATAELMQRFYTAHVKMRLTAAAALRQAQLEMSASSRWSSPRYWAAFVLQGEWR